MCPIVWRVESSAVVEDKVHICDKAVQRLIDICVKVDFDGAKVHWVINLLWIIRVFIGIHGL